MYIKLIVRLAIPNAPIPHSHLMPKGSFDVIARRKWESLTGAHKKNHFSVFEVERDTAALFQ